MSMDEPFDINVPYISGLFADRESAESAYSYLVAMGYLAEEINVAMESTTRDKLFSIPPVGSQSEKVETFNGPVEGSIMGGVMGGIAFSIGALGSNLGINGLNLVMMGPLGSSLVGTSLGAITGGIIGYLLSSGKPDREAELFTEGLRNGKILLAIIPHNKNDGDKIYKEWIRLDATAIKHD